MSTKGAERDSSDGEQTEDKTCPECGRDDFKNWKGMQNHRGQAHGPLRETLVCEVCGDEYEVVPSQADKRNCCSMECQAAWRSENLSGENHPRYKGGRITVTCGHCGEDFTVWPFRADEAEYCSRECYATDVEETGRRGGENHPMWAGGGSVLKCEQCGEQYEARRSEASRSRFCSRGCYWEWLSDTKTGENAPQWNGGLVEAACEQCGVQFTQFPSDDRRFCSRKCFGTWRSESGTFDGENHPLWNGGRFPYGEGWTKAKREQVRERQGRLCAGCGTDETELGKRLSVHHIQKARSFDDDEARNDDSILVGLCEPCHKVWERMSPLRPQTPYLD